jgi:hypothetical protein
MRFFRINREAFDDDDGVDHHEKDLARYCELHNN